MKNNTKIPFLLSLILLVGNSYGMDYNIPEQSQEQSQEQSREQSNEENLQLPIEILHRIISFAPTLEALENMLEAMHFLRSNQFDSKCLIRDIHCNKNFLKEFHNVTRDMLARYLFREAFTYNYVNIKYLCLLSGLLKNHKYLISELFENIIKHNDLKTMNIIINNNSYNKKYIVTTGKTPLQFALKHRRTEIALLLIKHNVKNNWRYDSKQEIIDIVESTKQDDDIYFELGLLIPNRSNLFENFDQNMSRRLF